MWRKFSLVMSALVILLTISYSLAAAQTGGGFNLTWSTVDGGGGVSTGGAFEVSGTIGQAEAGTLSGGAFTLSGGFWASSTVYRLYLPLIVKG